MHVRRFRPAAFATTVLVGLAVWSPQLAFAASTNTQHVAITPSSTELSIAPGASATSGFDVINQGTDSFSVTTSSSPYHVQGTDYDPQFTQLPGTVDASKWVHLSSTKLQSLAPNALQHVDYTVQVPAGTPPGGYYAVLFAETTPTSAANGVVAHNRVGDILYITVAGPVRLSGTVAAGKLSHVSTSGSVPVSILVRNTGGVHFKSTSTVTVTNLFGKQVFKQTAERFILPQTERNVSVTWSTRAPLGLYHVKRSATTPSGTTQLPAAWLLVAAPWVIVLAAALLVLLVAAVVRSGARRKRK